MIYRFWSPVLGSNAVRVSVHDGHGGEHYAIVPQAGTGKENRKLVYLAVDAVRRAADDADRGLRDPGEIEIDPDLTQINSEN